MPDFAAFLDEHRAVLFAGAFAWIAFWLLVSLAYRMWAQKPLFAHPSTDAVFTEAWTSGSSNKNVFAKLGGARNCLRVTVTPTLLEVRPHFPFTLFFPEVYDLEHQIPLSQVQAVSREKKLFTESVNVTYGPPGEPARSLRFVLRNPQEFINAFDLSSKAR